MKTENGRDGSPIDGLKSGDPGAAFKGRIGKTFTDSEPWWPQASSVADGAPNIVFILLDDLGFSDLGCFGAEFETPNIDRLANGGARFSDYTTVPMCTPARAALLTGKNPHSVGCGWITHGDPGYPGYGGEISQDAPTMAELLQQAGYSTMAIGKWHNTAEHNASASGDRSSWPVQRGFDRFYGFIASETSYFHPDCLYEGSQALDLDTYPEDYFATDDWTDRAIRWTKEHVASAPEKPFFLYLAYNAPHLPIQAKQSDLQKYRGRYDAGWDALREQRFSRQILSGLFPEGTRLPGRNPGIPAWADLTPEQQDICARYMEIYAALVDNLDQNIGRLVAFLKSAGLFDNTLIMLASDNGANSMGGEQGTVNAWQKRLGSGDNGAVVEKLISEQALGGPETYIAYPSGWAQVSNTPFRYFKRTPLNGGIRVPFIAHWPNVIKAGQTIKQWVHVSDVLPTLLDTLGISYPNEFKGYRTRPLDGISFAPLLKGVTPDIVRRSQHYELDGNRAFIQDGWKIVSLQAPGKTIALDDWMLFRLDDDVTEIDDQADRYPAQLAHLIEVFDREARANYVYPLDNRGYERALALAPHRISGINAARMFYAGAQTAERVSISPLFADRSLRIIAGFSYREGDCGVIYSVGGIFGGMLLYVLDGALHFVYQCWPTPVELTAVPLRKGQIDVVLDYQALGDRQGRGRLLVNGGESISWTPMSPTLGRLPGGGLDVGINRRQPASRRFAGYGEFAYTGEIAFVRVEPGAQAAGSLINAPEPLSQRLAVGRLP